MKMKRTIFTNKSDIRLGFEVECVVRYNVFGAFCRKLKALNRGINVGNDWSINEYGCGGYECKTAEVRTPPLPPKDAMTLLKNVFDLVNRYGFTNASCGLHVNISSAKKSKMKQFNPLPFISSKLWMEILRKFKREHNTYCCAPLKFKSARPSHVQILNRISKTMDSKYWAANMCHFGEGRFKNSRVEVRAFGNKHYHRKFDLIAAYVKRIERLFNLSCQDGTRRLTQTYAV